ncbi:DUF4129 domain-containing protein [Cellulomonas endophytica]|uniref:DUF4129 domain-containing protein n=1 Tax=Cellulomonas endophytica TaxID=2494735 RepID=UPI00196B967A|nr:DUF4129 domain-containing protein [Cellulomonas endophytica]
MIPSLPGLTAASPGAGVLDVLAALPGSVPVDPDAPTARRWLVEELARPEYHRRGTLLESLLAWLDGLFADVRLGSLPSPLATGLVALAVLAVVAVSLWVGGPVRRSRRTASARGVLAAEDDRDAAALRAAADAALAAGDPALALAERFRALVRALEERTVLDERPGRTAREAAATAGVRLPAHAADLRAAADRFDAVVYGHRSATRGEAEAVRALDEAVARARPTAPGAPPGGDGAAGPDDAGAAVPAGVGGGHVPAAGRAGAAPGRVEAPR